jgi:hypothetical protein
VQHPELLQASLETEKKRVDVGRDLAKPYEGALERGLDGA